MNSRSFKDFILVKEDNQSANGDWKKNFIQLEKGFIPPEKMRPVIEAFLKSGEIKLQDDTSKEVMMPKKSLFLVGGAVRDFLAGKSIKDFDLATNATPTQIAIILNNADFKMGGDKSGKDGEDLKLPFTPQKATEGDERTWFVKGRDNSPEKKPFVITAIVKGEEFEIATFRRDAKVTDGAAAVDFIDNPHEDASRRDLTINALYIELTKPDGENNKLYDPTKKGWHDVQHSVVRTVGNAEDRFREDKLRVLRAIRMHCRYGKGEMDSDMMKAMPKFKSLDGVSLERIRDEFIKGLTHPDIDPKCYIGLYRKTGLLEKVFPDINFDPPANMPNDINDQKDKPLALAWLLQHNPIEKVEAALSPIRKVGDEDKATGWLTQEKNAVIFLLKLKEFTPEQLPVYMRAKQVAGLTPEQIRNWVDMFNISGTNRNRRPWWANQVKAFADHQRSANWEKAQQSGLDVCPACKGKNPESCPLCKGHGKLPTDKRGEAVGKLEIQAFMDRLPKKKT